MPNTPWTQLEPPGAGLQYFGDPDTSNADIEEGILIHDRGFGDQITPWSESSASYATTWRQISPSLGWGLFPFGSPSRMAVTRGWGSPTTKWTNYDETP